MSGHTKAILSHVLTICSACILPDVSHSQGKRDVQGFYIGMPLDEFTSAVARKVADGCKRYEVGKTGVNLLCAPDIHPCSEAKFELSITTLHQPPVLRRIYHVFRTKAGYEQVVSDISAQFGLRAIRPPAPASTQWTLPGGTVMYIDSLFGFSAEGTCYSLSLRNSAIEAVESGQFQKGPVPKF